MTCCKEAEKVNFFAARKNIRKMKMKAPVLCSGILNNYHCGLSVLEVCVCVGVCVWCVCVCGVCVCVWCVCGVYVCVVCVCVCVWTLGECAVLLNMAREFICDVSKY